jgi:hypothetical protein
MTRICAAPGCDNPLIRRAKESPSEYVKRQTCCVRCGAALGKLKRGKLPPRPPAPPPQEFIPWPRVTGETDWNGAFARHNVVPGDGGPLRVSKPINHSPGSSSAAWAVQGEFGR